MCDIFDLVRRSTDTFQISWVKAHSNHPHNDCADKLAKTGRHECIDPQQPNNTPYIQAKIEIRGESLNQRQLKWDSGITARQIHQFEPKFSTRMYKEHCKLNNTNQKIITQLRTQHIALNAHLHTKYNKSRKNRVNTPNCQKCQSNTPETVEHFLLHCDSYIVIRDRMFQELKLVENSYERRNINLETLLFPKTNLSFQIRLKILQIVSQFVKDSKRLKFH